MRNNGLRFDKSVVTLDHQSARGKVYRNNGNFTRGSQLIGHQFFMFWDGVKAPVYLWLGSVGLLFALLLSALMKVHETPLVMVRLFAGFWSFMEFDRFKDVDIHLPEGMRIHCLLLDVPHIPAVRLAVAKFEHLTVASLVLGSILSALPIYYFIVYAHKRGQLILKERHERGAMMVEKAILVADILTHNREHFVREAKRHFGHLHPDAVVKLPFVARKAVGLHHPYTLADVPYPYGLEQSHAMLIGTTGAGKTTVLRDLVQQIRARHDSAVIFDLTGAYVEAFYDPTTDVILNPFDTRCPNWSVFTDCKTPNEFMAAAYALVPSKGSESDPFWAMAARTLFVEMCLKLQADGRTTNRALVTELMTADLKTVHRHLQNTTADPITAPEAARMAESIRAVFNTNAQVLQYLPTDGAAFSFKEWIHRPDKKGHLLFVTSRYVDMVMNQALVTLWMDLAINALMTLPRTRSLRTWFLFDELGALHRLPAIEHGLQAARNFGGAFVLGMHSLARLDEVYGANGADNMTGLARTKLILAAADKKTAERCTEFIGSREVREMDEAYSYGHSTNRDASTITPKTEIKALVIADDIVNLPELHGFLKFPSGFPATRITLDYRAYPEVAKGFDIRPFDPELLKALRRRETDEEQGGRDGSVETVTDKDIVKEAEDVRAAAPAQAPFDGPSIARIDPATAQLNFDSALVPRDRRTVSEGHGDEGRGDEGRDRDGTITDLAVWRAGKSDSVALARSGHEDQSIRELRLGIVRDDASGSHPRVSLTDRAALDGPASVPDFDLDM